tara:strand:+ start:125 stop:460 length:336 start_codon:yes stop_codon:yes gene_type:complete
MKLNVILTPKACNSMSVFPLDVAREWMREYKKCNENDNESKTTMKEMTDKIEGFIGDLHELYDEHEGTTLITEGLMGKLQMYDMGEYIGLALDALENLQGICDKYTEAGYE